MTLIRTTAVISLALLLFGCNEPGYPDNVKVKRINTDSLQALLVVPNHIDEVSQTPLTTAIVLGGSEGGLAGASATAVALAENGIAALAVGYFGVEGLPATLKQVPVEVVDAAVAYIDASPALTRNHCKQVALIGSSRGAELALLAASYNQDYGPVVALSPSSHTWGALGDSDSAAWTYQGEPVPFVPRHSNPDYTVTEFAGRNYFIQDLNHPDANKARIDAANIRGQVLLLAGTDDKLWPSAIMAETLRNSIASQGVKHRVNKQLYEGAGHVISPGLPDNLTQTDIQKGQTILLGGTPTANQLAQTEALKTIVATLKSPICYSSSAGFNPQKLARLKAFLKTTNTSSLVLMRGGEVVFQYGDIHHRHTIHSIRKPMLNALYGIYVDKGIIDLDITLGELGISDLTALSDVEKSATVRQLLQSRSGIYLPSAATNQAMLDMLPERGQFKPGEKYAYNNWDFNVAGAIFEKLAGESLYTVFYREIAKPLGMQQFKGDYVQATADTEFSALQADGFYQLEADKSEFPAYHFRMSAYDMALFGQLYENYGMWNGHKILSREWIEASTMSYSVTNRFMDFGYGMLWNVINANDNRPDKAFFHTGVGIHLLGVYPASDLVFVHRVQTEQAYTFNQQDLYKIIGRTFDALESHQPE